MSRRLHMLVNQIESPTLQNATCGLVSYLLEQIPRGVQVSPEIVLTTPHLAVQPETPPSSARGPKANRWRAAHRLPWG